MFTYACFVSYDDFYDRDHTIFFEQKNGGKTLREEDVAVSNIRIDLSRGSNNPLAWYLYTVNIIRSIDPFGISV